MNFILEQALTTARAIVFPGAGERNPGYALLLKANKPVTVLYKAQTFLSCDTGGLAPCDTGGLAPCDTGGNVSSL